MYIQYMKYWNSFKRCFEIWKTLKIRLIFFLSFFFYNIQNVFLIFETAAENMIHDFQDINEQINK